MVNSKNCLFYRQSIFFMQLIYWSEKLYSCILKERNYVWNLEYLIDVFIENWFFFTKIHESSQRLRKDKWPCTSSWLATLKQRNESQKECSPEHVSPVRTLSHKKQLKKKKCDEKSVTCSDKKSVMDRQTDRCRTKKK